MPTSAPENVALQYGGIDENTQEIKTLRVDPNTQNPTLTQYLIN